MKPVADVVALVTGFTTSVDGHAVDDCTQMTVTLLRSAVVMAIHGGKDGDGVRLLYFT